MHIHSTKFLKVYGKNKSLSFCYSSFSLVRNHSKPVSCISFQNYSIHLQIYVCVQFFFSTSGGALCTLLYSFFHLIYFPHNTMSSSWILFYLVRIRLPVYTCMLTIPLLDIANHKQPVSRHLGYLLSFVTANPINMSLYK